MAGATNTVLFGGLRRIRVLCTQPLAAGAFASLTFYAVTNVDGLGASPINVQAVFAIANNSSAFEVAVDSDLVSGALYSIAVTALPFADLSTFTGALQAQVPAAANTPNPQAELSTGDFATYYYGRDILLGDSGDFALSPTGDLATTSGSANWQAAILRRVMSNGIPWDVTYGALPNSYVNAPPQYQLPLSAKIVQQARADDRTLSCQVQLAPNPGASSAKPSGNVAQYQFQITVQGRDGLAPISVSVPAPTPGSG